MLLPIVKYGDKVLREKSRPVASVTPALRKLAEDMIETMHAAEGVGLAAQQVGRRESVFVVDVPPDCMKDPEVRAFNAPIRMPLVAFNPAIVSSEGSQRDNEGCLSFPGMSGHVTRPFEVTLSCLDIDGNPQVVNACGLLARAILHEFDHLNGVLYVDHLSAVEKLTMAGKLKKLAKANGGAR